MLKGFWAKTVINLLNRYITINRSLDLRSNYNPRIISDFQLSNVYFTIFRCLFSDSVGLIMNKKISKSGDLFFSIGITFGIIISIFVLIIKLLFYNYTDWRYFLYYISPVILGSFFVSFFSFILDCYEYFYTVVLIQTLGNLLFYLYVLFSPVCKETIIYGTYIYSISQVILLGTLPLPYINYVYKQIPLPYIIQILYNISGSFIQSLFDFFIKKSLVSLDFNILQELNMAEKLLGITDLSITSTLNTLYMIKKDKFTNYFMLNNLINIPILSIIINYNNSTLLMITLGMYTLVNGNIKIINTYYSNKNKSNIIFIYRIIYIVLFTFMFFSFYSVNSYLYLVNIGSILSLLYLLPYNQINLYDLFICILANSTLWFIPYISYWIIFLIVYVIYFFNYFKILYE